MKLATLHVGTNDIETRKPADLFADKTVQVAVKIKDNTKATAYISTIPLRADALNAKRDQLNKLLRKSLPESIHIIDNDDLVVDDLYDKKHIMESSIGKLVSNMNTRDSS